MTAFIHRLALLISILTLIICVISGISLLTSLVRAAVVFIGILFTFFIAGQILNLGLSLTNRKPKAEEEK